MQRRISQIIFLIYRLDLYSIPTSGLFQLPENTLDFWRHLQSFGRSGGGSVQKAAISRAAFLKTVPLLSLLAMRRALDKLKIGFRIFVVDQTVLRELDHHSLLQVSPLSARMLIAVLIGIDRGHDDPAIVVTEFHTVTEPHIL